MILKDYLIQNYFILSSYDFVDVRLKLFGCELSFHSYSTKDLLHNPDIRYYLNNDIKWVDSITYSNRICIVITPEEA